MRGGDRGVALIMTLWVLVLLTAVAMSLSFSSRRGSASTRNMKEDIQAYYLSLSAYEEVLAYLLTDPEPDVDFLDESGNFRTDDERAPLESSRSTEASEVKIRIVDEDSKLNINTLGEEALLKLFEHTGIPDDARQPIVHSLFDWKDSNDLFRLLGAEDEYYETYGYGAKNSPLDTLEELLLIKGFEPEYLYGGSETKPLYPLITTYGTGLNVNTVDPQLLYILGVPEATISSLLAHRSAEGGTKMVPKELAPFKGTSASSNFRIEVVARMKQSPRGVRITSVVNRRFSGGGAELRTLYWKEDFETGRP